MTLNDELGRTWEEAGMASFMAVSQHLPRSMRKTMKDLAVIASRPTIEH
jgi:hypothetical protein